MPSATVFECTAFGQQSSKWLGRCPGCGGWNTLEQVASERRARTPGPAVEPIPLTHAELADVRR